jgi:hypothetical protein
MAAEVATDLAELRAETARLAVQDEQAQRLVALAASAETRLGSDGNLAESLALRSAAESLAMARDDTRRRCTDRAAVAARLGLLPEARLPDFAAPGASALLHGPPAPAVIAARARAEGALAELAEARAARRPEMAIGLGYEREEVPDAAMDTVRINVRVAVPVWGAATNEQESAALARHRAARREELARQHAVAAAVAEQQRAHTQAAAAERVAAAARARLQAQEEALLRSVASGSAGLLAVLELLERQSAVAEQAIAARLAAERAAAAGWRLIDPDAFATGTPP